jgi:hypothetical protein
VDFDSTLPSDAFDISGNLLECSGQGSSDSILFIVFPAAAGCSAKGNMSQEPGNHPTMRPFDEHALLARLEPLDRGAKTAFAAACAQRLLPLFGRYASMAGVTAHAQRLAEILAAAWDVSSGRVIDLRSMDSEVESMVPKDYEGEWVMESGYGQNAAAAVAYAIRTWLTDDPQEAAWAAFQMYEVAEYAVTQSHAEVHPSVDVTDAMVVGSEIAQAALLAMEEDLGVVASAPPSWRELRQRAEVEGRSWTATFP